MPCVIGEGGVEKIVEIELNKTEKKMLDKSINAVNSLVDACKKIAPKLGK